MEIPFHRPYITEREINEVVDALRNGWLTMGPKTHKFEENFAHYLGVSHAIAVSSATAALHLALYVIGLKPGDEVIIPTMTFTATGEVVRYFDAKPVLCDVDRKTHNILPQEIDRKITKKTRAIIPVHFGGLPANMDEIREIAERHHLYVIEDAAHALPAWYKNKKIGTLSDITCFSFYATKTLATGEGGMVVTENEEWSDKIKVMRLHGISKDAWKRYTKEGSWYYEVIEAGYKYNITDIQAALGLAQLEKLEWMWKKRKEVSAYYTEKLSSCEKLILPEEPKDRLSAWHLYPIKLKIESLPFTRDEFIEKLRAKGIGTSVHFIPLHKHPYYKKLLGPEADPKNFPNAEWIYERSISLPIYPSLTKKEQDYIVENIISLAHT